MVTEPSLEAIRALSTEDSTGQTLALMRATLTEPLDVIRALSAAGSVERAVDLIEAALALNVSVEQNVRLRCLLAEGRIMAGRFAEGVADIDDLMTDATKVPDSVLSAMSASRVFGLYFQNAEAGSRYARSVLLAHNGRAAASSEAMAAATVLSDAAMADGRLGVGLDLAKAAARGADGMPSPVWRPYLRLELATRLTDVGAYSEAEEALRIAQVDIEAVGGAALQAAHASRHARVLSHYGRLAEAREETQRALSTSLDMGSRLFIPALLAMLAELAFRSGDVSGAADLVRDFRSALAESTGVLRSVGYDWIDLQVTAAQEGPLQAVNVMRSGSRAGRRALFARQPDAAAWYVRTALQAGDHHWASTAAAESRDLSRQNPGFNTAEVAALHATSLLTSDLDGLVHAATGHRHQGARTAAAEDLTALLGSAIRPPATAPGLPSVDPDREAWVTLSDTEREIARLVSEGLTNQQVAFRVRRSQHTVNFHLRNIFRKLGIVSRVELARRAHHWPASET